MRLRGHRIRDASANAFLSQLPTGTNTSLKQQLLAEKVYLDLPTGHLLATSGYRVLVVDVDPQGNLAEDLGYTDDSRDAKGRSLAQALMFGGGAAPVVGVRTGLDVLVGGSVLDQATAGLSSRANKDPDGAKLALAQLLVPLAGGYDMILIDCPPGDETLQTAAVAAARWALVPVKTDKSSRKGLGRRRRKARRCSGDQPDS